jgi:hypothetical protein
MIDTDGIHTGALEIDKGRFFRKNARFTYGGICRERLTNLSQKRKIPNAMYQTSPIRIGLLEVSMRISC